MRGRDGAAAVVPAPARVVALLLAVVTLFACDATSHVKWTIRASPMLAIARVVVRITRGTCDSPAATVYETSFAPADMRLGASPALEDGVYAFRAIAFDASCTEIASACIGDVVLPRPSDEEVILRLVDLPDVPCAGTCTAGVCGGRDGGVDPDAGAGDAGLDTAPRLRAPANGAYTVTHDTAILRPGPLLQWDPVPGASRYEAEIGVLCGDVCGTGCTDACATAGPGELEVRYPNTPAFPLTTTETSIRAPSMMNVSEVAPMGRRYWWHVRACDEHGCARWSDLWHFDHGRAANNFDGDGSSDVVVGGTDGRVTWWAGAVFPPWDPPRPPPSGSFDVYCEPGVRADRVVVAGVGDVDIDGYADLAVGAPECAGRPDLAVALLFFGGTTPFTRAPLELGRGTPSAGFATAIAGAGDVDADGRADVIVGAPNDGAAGRAFIFLASGTTRTLEVPSSAIDPLAGFGTAVASAQDVDRDGFADVVVGAPRLAAPDIPLTACPGCAEAGGAFVFSGAVATRFAVLENFATLDAGEVGMSLSAGDFTGDGLTEVAVGAPNATFGVFVGGLVGLYRSDAWDWSPVRAFDIMAQGPGADPLARYGSSVLLVDRDLDGACEVVVGAERLTGPGGMSTGGAFSYTSRNHLFLRLYDPGPLSAESGARAGLVMTAVDVHGNGGIEIAIGAPGTRGGLVFVTDGSTDAGSILVRVLEAPGSRGLGSSIALAWWSRWWRRS